MAAGAARKDECVVLRKVYIKEIDETVPFGLLKTYEVTDHRDRRTGELRVLYGVSEWVIHKIFSKTSDGIVTCVLEEDSALFYATSEALVELEPRRIGTVNFDEAIKTVQAILKRGNDVEIRRKGDGYIVLEVKKTIKYSTPAQ